MHHQLLYYYVAEAFKFLLLLVWEKLSFTGFPSTLYFRCDVISEN